MVRVLADRVIRSILYYPDARLFFFSRRRRHTRYMGDWSSDVCSSDLDNQRATELLLKVSADAERVGAAEEFAELADHVLWRLSGDDRELSARLLRTSATLFAASTRHDEAAELYRRLIADRATSEDLDAFQ